MTTQIHFAGMNTAALAQALEGKPVLISYADIVRRPGVWEQEILPRLQQNLYPSVILDSGAFTELTTPSFHVDVVEYARFVEKHDCLFDVIVNLDDIAGNVQTSQNNQRIIETINPGVEVMPVFHGREDWEVLEQYLNDGYDHIGVGFARDEGRIAKDQGNGRTPREWLAEVFDRVRSRATVHGFGMTRYANEFDFLTTDSTTWIAEYRAITKEIDDGKRGHGCTGRLAEMVGRLSQQQQLKLVLDSYSAKGGEPCEEAIGESFWQARTVVKRYGASELAGKLGYAVVVVDDREAGRMYAVIELESGEEIARMFSHHAAAAVIDDQLEGAARKCPHN